ncbi:putative secreted hydrolase [Thermosporothrix hazakensis]|uniref:Carotenoid 1,2-hydratase n=2 Tax=Thermosporothrix TaxID=768650 RepID=A0A455SRX6_9CHLR|nr:lipocalin family protein [Thermosporothrix hazakensis]PZW21025.1 putative secreted hydrolase [Thermosporothrix hazakensis]BBH91163.1 carotenoid 1,2-hydratase [Thermosporothrix sp. COM3]GCE49308.1 carotenoid 1,2-hydratase [Thermosporothrix hazakensis]
MNRARKQHPYWLILVAVLGILLSSCGFPGMVSTTQQLPPVKPTPSPTPLPPARLPQDDGRHNNLTEWWYYTGHLTAKEATGKLRHYGFEFVIFQVLRADLPPFYASHFAITDKSKGTFQYDQRRIMSPTIARNDVKGFDLHIGDWTMQGYNGQDHLAASMQNYAITLQLAARKPAALHNGDGLIPYGLAGFSYYYSRTKMNVSGSIVDHGQMLQIEQGQAWMDHQWGDFLTLASGGWEWFSLQLHDNSEIMVYYIRDASGKVLATYVGYVDASGKDIVLPASALHTTILEQWKSPHTGFVYPSGWKIEITDKRIPITLLIKPVLKDQELVVKQTTGNVYWEGAVTVEGQKHGKPVTGDGYVELTGFTKKRQKAPGFS